MNNCARNDERKLS